MSKVSQSQDSKPWRNPLRSATGWRPEDWGLLALFLLALLAASPIGHVLATFALISIIGIPIYFILAVIPALFAYALLARLVLQTWRSWRAGSFLGMAIAGVLAALLADLLVFGAWRENYRLDRLASALMARDSDALTSAGRADTLAIVRNTLQTRDPDTLCDDLCLRLLLNDGAKRVIAVTLAPPARPPADRRAKRPNSVPARSEWPALDFDPARQGTLYWLEQRAQCADTKVPENLRSLKLPVQREPGQTLRRATRSDESMRLKIAAGRCLMSRQATLAEAGAALAYGTVKSGEGEYSAAEKLSADTISAWQITYAVKQGADFVVSYRATGFSMYRLPWLRIPFYVHGSEFRMKTGWLRLHTLHGGRGRYQSQAPVEAFAMERLGLNLRLDQTQGPAGGADAVSRILDSRNAALGENDAKILRDFVNHAGTHSFNRNGKLSAEDAGRIVRIAADARVTLDWQFGNAAAAVAREAPGRGVELARHLFARLDALVDAPAEGQEEARWREPAGALAGALARLSDDHLRPFRAQMEKIARTPRKRDRARQLLARLDLFGPEITPLLHEMLRASAAEAQTKTGKRQRNAERGAEGFAAALGAFCRLGPRASASLDGLARQLQTLDSPPKRRNFDHTIATLVQMGASEERVREIMQIDGGDAKALQQFGFAVRRANGRNACF